MDIEKILDRLDFTTVEEYARNSFEFFLLLLIAKPLLYIASCILAVVFILYICSGFGVLAICHFIDQQNYIGAILIVIFNIFLLSIIVYSKYKEFKIKLEKKNIDSRHEAFKIKLENKITD